MKGLEFNRSTLLEILNAREATIRFRKLDGELRTMRCTLSTSLLPTPIQENLDKISYKRTQKPEDLITVFDLDNEGWRSFHLGSIIEVL